MDSSRRTDAQACLRSAPGLEVTIGRVSSESVYDGRIVRLSLDTVRFPDGSTGVLEMIRHPGAAAVLPFVGALSDPDPEVLLIRQYRYAAGGYIYEVPAGLRQDDGEEWGACACRELEEETGMRAGELIPLTWILTTPGFTDEVIHLFVATALVPGESSRDADEFIEVVRLPFSRVMRMVQEGGIVDCKTIAAILYTASFILPGRRASPRDSVEDVS